MFRAGERLDYPSKTCKELEKLPHIALWDISPGPSEMGKPGYHKNQNWYVALHWRAIEPDGYCDYQRDLTDFLFYSRGVSEAIRHAKRLNLVAVRSGIVDVKILWAPRGKTTPEQQTALLWLQRSKDKKGIFYCTDGRREFEIGRERHPMASGLQDEADEEI